MDDLISRSALLELYADTEDIHFAVYNVPIPVVRQNILDAPAVDAVEVCRCKDCKHYCPYEGEEHKGDCAELVGLESCVYEDDFCSYGERRAGDGN